MGICHDQRPWQWSSSSCCFFKKQLGNSLTGNGDVTYLLSFTSGRSVVGNLWCHMYQVLCFHVSSLTPTNPMWIELRGEQSCPPVSGQVLAACRLDCLLLLCPVPREVGSSQRRRNRVYLQLKGHIYICLCSLMKKKSQGLFQKHKCPREMTSAATSEVLKIPCKRGDSAEDWKSIFQTQ